MDLRLPTIKCIEMSHKEVVGLDLSHLWKSGEWLEYWLIRLNARRCHWWNISTDLIVLQNLRIWFFESLAAKVSVGRLALTLCIERFCVPGFWTVNSDCGGTECLMSLVTHFIWEWLGAQTYSVVFRHFPELHISWFFMSFPFLHKPRGRWKTFGFLSHPWRLWDWGYKFQL